MIMYYQTMFGCKRISSSEGYSRNCHILIIWALAVTLTLTLKIANWSFCMTLWLMIMHNNTKFGNQLFGGLEDIIWTNMGILTFHCDLDLECSNPLFFCSFSYGTLAYDDVSSDHVWLPKNQQFNRYNRKVIFWAYRPLLQPWLWKRQTIFFSRMTLWLMMLHHHTKFGNKMFSGSKDIRTTIHWQFESSLWQWPYPIFPQYNLAYDAVLSNQVANRPAV